MKEKNGGPAFPVTMENTSGEYVKFFGQEVPDKSTYFSGGMTLRDYFAGKALAGMILRQNEQAIPYEDFPKVVAFESFRIADAMLAESERGGE